MSLTVVQLSNDIWQINEQMNSVPYVDAYLITGNNRALLIDALQDGGGLVNIVRECTSLPVDVLITHGHRDHAGKEIANLSAAGFDLYINGADLDILSDAQKKCNFNALSDGQLFDIGGRVLETRFLPGHTLGSTMFIDKENRQIFSGDTVGSGGIWLQSPRSLPLGEYLRNLKAFYQELAAYDRVSLFVGHRQQWKDADGKAYIADLIETIERIISGELVGVPFDTGNKNTSGLNASYGLVSSCVYKPDRL